MVERGKFILTADSFWCINKTTIKEVISADVPTGFDANYSRRFEAQQVFHLWRRVRDGTLDRAFFFAVIRPIKQRVGELLHKGRISDHPKTAKTCANLLKIELSLWTFVSVEGVEWIMIVVATLKQQKRNVLEYLQSVCLAQIRGEKAPSLLPNPTPESQPTV